MLEKLSVTVYSLSKPFNTSTKEGRMIRNNLLSLAQFERETIAGRLADAYSTRDCEIGFFHGGTMIFCYNTVNTFQLSAQRKGDLVRVQSNPASGLYQSNYI